MTAVVTPAVPGLTPEADDLWAERSRVVWRSLAGLFLAGGVIGALSLLLPHPAGYDDAGLWRNVAVAFLAVPALYAASRFLPLWSVHVFVVAGTILITRAIYLSDDPSGFYTLWYVWVGLYAFFFFGRRWGLIQMGVVGLAYAWVLLLIPASSDGVARWVTTIATLGVGGLMVDALARKLQRLAARYAAIARDRENLLVALEEIANTDELTGLPNRRAWNEELEREMARARREATPLSVAVIDLDRFKEYNDELGHQAGDRFLKAVTAAWRQRLRSTDSLARYGGEEFALTLPGCDTHDAAALVERLRAVVPERQTCSAGIAAWDGSESASELLGRADAVLYEAKKAGRDRIQLAA